MQDIVRTSLTGPATVILSGFTVGLESAVYTALLIGGAVFGAYLLGGGSVILGLFCVALAGTGLLTTVGVIVAMDTFGPISDNAQGIAEMSGDIDEEGARVLTDLDAVGNTTKAITKGIAISTAVLAATALFGSFTDCRADRSRRHRGDARRQRAQPAVHRRAQRLGPEEPGRPDHRRLGGLHVLRLAINAVTRAAGAIVFEVRRQFREIPGIMEGTGKPEYGKVVDICTRDSLRELATPGLLAVLAPIAVGFGLGVGALGSYLAGAIATGTLMAILLANSGGAWDNAKKIVEDGAYGGKGSPAHEATVIGDTVGDPFKDTAGPAINPLIKVMNLVSLLIAPAIVSLSIGDDSSTPLRILVALVAVAIIVGAVVLVEAQEHRGRRGEGRSRRRAGLTTSRPVLRRTPAPTGCARRSWRPATRSTASRSCSVRRRRPRWAGTRRCRPGGPPRTADRSRRWCGSSCCSRRLLRRTSPPCCRWTSRCPSASSAPTVTRSAPAWIFDRMPRRTPTRTSAGGWCPTSGPASTACTGRSTASTCSGSAVRRRPSRSSRRVTRSAAPSTSAPAPGCRPCTRAGTAARSWAPTCPGGRCSSRG